MIKKYSTFVLLLTCSVSHALTWSMREVVPSGEFDVVISGINNAGQIAASSQYNQRALRINPDGSTNVLQASDTGYRFTAAGGINENGEVAVFGERRTESPGSKVSYWTPGVGLTGLVAPDPGEYFSVQSFAINNSRSAVGWAQWAGPGGSVPSGIATYYSPDSGGYLVPGNWDGDNLARDINDAGNIVGCVNLNPIRWNQDGSYTSLALAGHYGVATSINSSGMISGVLNSSSRRYLAIWNAAGQLVQKIDIGSRIPVPSAPTDYSFINDNGDVVVTGVVNGAARQFFWSQSTGILDFTDSISNRNGFNLTIRGINNRREIICNGYLGTNYKYNLLLTPVPEPSELVALGVGLVGVGLTRLKRKAA
ncbi:MAG: PEP-CTERM sorting domain-containing protein [Armatimonadetes bacterium]|nr:PEP-CTERM sorting domain-containing protein [Armatimonadota bacterium]